jgi:hypothetical protein
MHSRTRTATAVVFAVLVAMSASAAPESRSESRDWFSRKITQIVQELKNMFAPVALTDPDPIPPKP